MDGTQLAKTAAMPMRVSASELVCDHDPSIGWTVALAGGEGLRLQEYVTQRFGHRMPKQYCPLLGPRTMLEQTLERMNALAPPSRTITVIGSEHAEWARPQLAGRSDHVFCQPASRDTGTALYVALAMIMRWHPNAIVTITPTDHHIAPADRFLDAVSTARSIADRLRDRVVLLGVAPTRPDPELGYVVLGPAIPEAPAVREITAFIEKPAPHSAAELASAGALWSTMVMSGSLTALWELGRAAAPRMLEVLDMLVPLIGTVDEDDAIDYVYRAYRPLSFSRDICERASDRIFAMPIVDVEWSDCGKPEAIERVRERTNARPIAHEHRELL